MNIPVVMSEGRSVIGDGKAVTISGMAQALSDPIRVKMLSMMAAGRECCSIPDCGVPERDKGAGICVCEFERTFDMGQSKVSYHLKKLKDSGLVHEEKRGRWSYYSVDETTAKSLLSELEYLLKMKS